MVEEGYAEVEEIMMNYNMGFITNNERYNQVIDTWTHVNAKLTQVVMKTLIKRPSRFQLGLYDA
jgi:DNA-directed RNA polymerase subunit beta'